MRLKHLLLLGFLCLASAKYASGDVSGATVTRTKRSTSDESSSSSESSEETEERGCHRKQELTTKLKLKIQQGTIRRPELHSRRRQHITNERVRIVRQKFQEILRHNKNSVNLNKQLIEKQNLINLNRNTWLKREQQKRLQENNRRKYEERRIFQEKYKEIQKRNQEENFKQEEKVKAARKAYLQNILYQKNRALERQKYEENMKTSNRKLQNQLNINRQKEEENEKRIFEERKKELMKRKQEENMRRLRRQLQEEKKRLQRENNKKNEQLENKLSIIKDNRAKRLLPCDNIDGLGLKQRNPNYWGTNLNPSISVVSTSNMPRNFLSTSNPFPYNLYSNPKSVAPSNTAAASRWSNVATVTPTTLIYYNDDNDENTSTKVLTPTGKLGHNRKPNRWTYTKPAVYDNCSKKSPSDLPNNGVSTEVAVCRPSKNNQKIKNLITPRIESNSQDSISTIPVVKSFDNCTYPTPLESNSRLDSSSPISNMDSRISNVSPDETYDKLYDSIPNDKNKFSSNLPYESKNTDEYWSNSTPSESHKDFSANTRSSHMSTPLSDGYQDWPHDNSSKDDTDTGSNDDSSPNSFTPTDDWADNSLKNREDYTAGANSGIGSSSPSSTNKNTYNQNGATGWPGLASSSRNDGPTISTSENVRSSTTSSPLSDDDQRWSNDGSPLASAYADSNNAGLSTTCAPRTASDSATNDWADSSSPSKEDATTDAYSGAGSSSTPSTDIDTYGQNSATGGPDNASSGDNGPTIGISVNLGSTATSSPLNDNNQDWSNNASPQANSYPYYNNDGLSTTSTLGTSSGSSANDWADGSSTSKKYTNKGAYSGTDGNTYGQNGAIGWPDNTTPSSDGGSTINTSENFRSTTTPSPFSLDNQYWSNDGSSQASTYADSNYEDLSTTCAPGAETGSVDGSSTNKEDPTSGAYSGAGSPSTPSTDRNTYGQNGATGWPDTATLSCDDGSITNTSENSRFTTTPSPFSNDNQYWSHDGSSQASTYADSNYEDLSTTCAPGAAVDGSSTNKEDATTGTYSGAGSPSTPSTDGTTYGQNSATGGPANTSSGDDGPTIAISVNLGSTATPSPFSDDNRYWSNDGSSQASTHAISNNKDSSTTCAPDAAIGSAANNWADGSSTSGADSSATPFTDGKTYDQNGATGWPDTINTSENFRSTATSPVSSDDNQYWSNDGSSQASTYADSTNEDSSTTCAPSAETSSASNDWADGSSTSKDDATTGAYFGVGSSSTPSTDEKTYGQNGTPGWPDSINTSENLRSTITPSSLSNDNQYWSNDGPSEASTNEDFNNEGSSTTCAPDVPPEASTYEDFNNEGSSTACAPDGPPEASTYEDFNNQGSSTTCAPDASSDNATNNWTDGSSTGAYSGADSSSTASTDDNSYGQNYATGWPDNASSDAGSFATSSSYAHSGNGASTDSTSGSGSTAGSWNNPTLSGVDGFTTDTYTNASSAATSTTSNDGNQDWNGDVSSQADNYAGSNASSASADSSSNGWTNGTPTSGGDTTTSAYSGAQSSSAASTNESTNGQNDATGWLDSA